MQTLITKQMNLLDKNGNLLKPGYATSQVWQYDREMIKASILRIKEWDYYYVGNEHFGVALTIADNSYMGLISASLLDFDTKYQNTKSKILPFTLGKLALPCTSSAGTTSYQNKKLEMIFGVHEEYRHLRCNYQNFEGNNSLLVDIKLTDLPHDTMVIATPFEKKKAFYYNQKINTMSASGYVQLGNKRYNLGEKGDLGLLDWGRGVWTYKNTWYWSSLNTVLGDGRKFGFNLGYGFGDTSAASENMLFLDGIADKLNDVTFFIPRSETGEYDYLSDWSFFTSDKRLSLIFRPILNRAAKMSAGIIASDQNQVFGKFYGNIKLQSGEIITLDGEVGFAERVFNKW